MTDALLKDLLSIHPRDSGYADLGRLAAEEITNLRNLLRMPLSSAELKLVDKHCDWVAFGHAWNAVIKHRLAAITAGELGT